MAAAPGLLVPGEPAGAELVAAAPAPAATVVAPRAQAGMAGEPAERSVPVACSVPEVPAAVMGGLVATLLEEPALAASSDQAVLRVRRTEARAARRGWRAPADLRPAEARAPPRTANAPKPRTACFTTTAVRAPRSRRPTWAPRATSPASLLCVLRAESRPRTWRASPDGACCPSAAIPRT